MYENENEKLNGNMSPDEHKVEESTPNFIMRDSEYQQKAADQNQGSQWQQARDEGQGQGSQWSQGQTQNQFQSQQQNQGQGQGQNQSSQWSQGQTQNQFQNQPQNQGQTQSQFQNQPQSQFNNSNSQWNQNWSQPQPDDLSGKGRKNKKRSGFASKAAGITAAALLFGTIAGGTMVGINMVANSMKQEQYTQVGQTIAQEETEALPETEADTSSSPVSESASASAAVVLDVSDIVEKAMPSIVAINNTMLYQSNSWFGRTQTYEVPSSGSGIIVGENDEELLIVTNNHVVEDSEDLSVVFIDSTSVSAAIKGTDSEADLAVIAVSLKDIPEDTLSQISIAKLGDSDALKVGQGVIAIGNALGYGQSVTVGWVSALDREVTTDGTTTRNLLQTDAAINPGNSGGALLNMQGEVIGINAAKYSSTDVEGIGYAIPISKAQDIISSLMTKRTRIAVEEGQEGYLGIQGLTVDDTMIKQLDMPAGIFVYRIIEGGAASKTDLREKDIITKFDGQTVKTMANLQDMLKYYKEGETVEMTVKSLENGEYVERTVEITLGGKATLGQDTDTNK